MSGETTDTPSDDVAEAFERLETVLADRIQANAELQAAVQACRDTNEAEKPALYERLERQARSDTENLKRLLASPQFEIDLTRADVDAWDEIETLYDDPEDEDDRPFR